MNMKELGNRCKHFEREAQTFIDPNKILLARLDGRGFSKFTKNLTKPFDKEFSLLMIATTDYLMEKYGADVSYTQSDEITLLWKNPTENFMFGGKTSKLLSLLAASATAYFNTNLKTITKANQKAMPEFDCRLFQVQNTLTAFQCVAWREFDVTRNAKQMAARGAFSHKECLNKTTDEMVAMLKDKGIVFSNYAPMFTKGTLKVKRTVSRKFTSTEISKLPKKHEARKNPNLVYERQENKLVSYKGALIDCGPEVIFDATC